MNFDPFRSYTQARIGLGHLAPAMPTKAWLEFAYHHARAVDAVHLPWNILEQQRSLSQLTIASDIVTTQALNREDYLMRPDNGRTLSIESQQRCSLYKRMDRSIIIVLSNGLSTTAVTTHGLPFLSLLLAKLQKTNLPVGDPILLVENARVALIDHVGSIVKAQLGLIIIGERPGLSAHDSLAVYLTYHPRQGLTDASRNCISNIRPPFGLSYEAAADQALLLVQASLSRKLSGVHLKDDGSLALKSHG